MGNWRSDLRVKVGTFTRSADAATGNVSYTGVGFRARAILVLMGNTTSFVESSIGISDGSSDYCVTINGAVQVATDDLLILFNNATAGTDMQTGALSSFDSDGFTIAWAKVGAPAAETLTCYYLALG